MNANVVKLIGLLICIGVVGCNSVRPGDGKPLGKNSSGAVLDPTDEANQLMSQGKFSEAIKLLTPYVNNMPAGWQSRMETADKITIHYWDQEQLTQCFVVDALANKKVDAILGGSYSRAYYMLAFNYLELKDAKKANDNLDSGLALEPDSAIILGEKGTLYQMTGQPDSAVTFFQKAIDTKGCKSDRDIGKAYRGLGISLIDLEKLDEAETALYTSLKYSPDNKIAINELNYIDKLRDGSAKQPISDKLQKTK